MNINTIKVIFLSLLASFIFSSWVFAAENPVPAHSGCDEPINPENSCLKLNGNTYFGKLSNEKTGDTLEVDIHFDKVTCIFTDQLHPHRDIFRLQGVLNKHDFSIDHGNYERDCVTNYDKQIFDFHIKTNDHIMKLDYHRKLENPALCDAAFGEVLCVEVTDQDTHETFVGVLEKK